MSRREPRTEIVSVRMTKAEKARLEKMGGSAALRRALAGRPPIVVPVVVIDGRAYGTAWAAWEDGTVGLQWPASNTR